MAPSVDLTAPATPWLPLAPVPVGHLTVLSVPTLDFHVGLAEARKPVKPLVVPEESERWTTVIDVLGSLTPGFSAAIAGSFHFLTVPRKMFAIVGPSSLSPVLRPLTL